jgi:diguanylate cyclase (GGDEF)-like protein/PAS domain S-box-containing protein
MLGEMRWLESEAEQSAEADERSLLHAFLETTPDVVLFKDREGRYLAVSRTFCEPVGVNDPEELVGLRDIDVVEPRSFAERMAAIEAEIVRTGRPVLDVEHVVTRRDGDTMWMTWSKMPLLDDDGQVVGTFTVARDTTERKLAEVAQRAQSERLARVVETQRDIAAADLDLESVMRFVCERTQELTGAPGATIILCDDERAVFRCATGYVSQVDGVELPLDTTLTAMTTRRGQSAIVHDTHAEHRLGDFARSHGVRSLVAVPLRHGDDFVGQLSVVSPEPYGFGDDAVHTLELLSVVLSSALSHAAAFEAKREQVEALTRYRTIFEAAPIGVVRTDAEANAAIQRMLGYSAEELAELSYAAYTHEDDLPRCARVFGELIDGTRDWYQLEKRFFRKDGEMIWSQVTARLVRAPDGQPAYAIAMIEDISKRKAAEEGLLRQAQLNEQQALHDSLTGLANRTLFRDRIEYAIRAARRDGGRVGVVMIDLDRFKEVNDSLGHHAGDELLQELGRRLEGAVRSSDTVARLGGDEFGLLLTGRCEPDGVALLLREIADAVETPVVIQELPLGVEASIGVAFYPDHGDDVDTLLRHADVAMYLPKESDSPAAFYDAESDTYDPVRLTLVGELRRAIEQRELVLHYQPKALLTTGAICSVEALLRWHHPQRGLVMPDDFIPLAQQTGLMKPLTLYVVEEALAQAAAWRGRGLELPIAVNLSMRNLLDLELPEQIAALLAKWEVAPELLELEITESHMLGDPVRSKLVLERLSALGLGLAIDDFGTGYSSLRHLRRLPIREIKIDRSFVANMVTDEDDATIVRSTIEVGRNLGLRVVAEGVETMEIWHRLAALGCTIAQGTCLSDALPADELEVWLGDRDRVALVAV